MKGDVCQTRNIDDMFETDDYFRRTYLRMSENRVQLLYGSRGTQKYPSTKIKLSGDLDKDSTNFPIPLAKC